MRKQLKEMLINISDDLKKQFHATCVMQGKKMNQVVLIINPAMA
ncbi:hypothetical protein [Scytonema sp. NUACC26]